MPARKTYGSNKSDPPQTSWVHGIISELCGNRVGGMLTPRVKNSGRVWRHGLRSSKQNENHGHSPWFSQGKWPGGYTIIYSRKFWVRLMRTLHSLGSHRSFACNPGMSLIFPPTFISYLPLVAHISLRSSPGVCFNLPRTTAESTLMHRRPKRTAISLLCPPGTSDFLYLSPSHAVSPTRFLCSLSCGPESLASARSSVRLSDLLYFFPFLPASSARL